MDLSQLPLFKDVDIIQIGARNMQNFDLLKAVRAAATDYAKTPDGFQLYEHNVCEINWGDFNVHVPNEICEKHGFRKVDADFLPDIYVNFDEDLVDEDQVYSECNDESEEKS